MPDRYFDFAVLVVIGLIVWLMPLWYLWRERKAKVRDLEYARRELLIYKTANKAAHLRDITNRTRSS